ncbi:P-loop containing nucleoside triphosphate hydrolases superfamily protein [Raphanus sativus]|uniref:AAA-ATPase At4g30250 n=1 Tax=Raphanus sativus TaxID=3726 RepID=A0A6J0LDT7_RAPSA|nr:AAA-ATPase At4g30250 [Raphanus sativus]KAJ4914352.1 P-loop containing nucleoside triphosphate hydrolases superfamily protein [Raphanus sativus]
MKMSDYWTTMASLVGMLAFCQTILQLVFPPELRLAFVHLLTRMRHVFSSHTYFDITEIDGVNTNELYNAVSLYLSSSVTVNGSVSSAAGNNSNTRLSLTRVPNSSSVTFGLSNNDRITDVFDGATVLWEHVVVQRQVQSFSWRPMPEEKRGFTLQISKRDRALVLDHYLDHIVGKAEEIRRRSEERLLYTNSRGVSLDARSHPWDSVRFKHPSTFETLAMDPERKRRIMEDLREFANGQGFYQKTGRAWKRGYLLYGPPGTGKSSLIAAMANYLGYDIYDLELTEVQNNSELRKLLMKTSSKSIIVIEDIDCSISLTKRDKVKKKNKSNNGCYDPDLTSCGSGLMDEPGSSVTLSGLLNFTDGLWSCCGSERIFVFTTNHIEKLDSALLRSGRMDMHIHMGFCRFQALKILLKNYLRMEEGDVDGVVLKEMEECVEEAEITPADVSEVLIRNRSDAEKAVRELVCVLKERVVRRRKSGGVKKKKEEGEDEEEEEAEEEQEKRALDSPNRNREFFGFENEKDEVEEK